ncbi:Arc family DNA-binding protein [Actinomycetospora sp. OC33-EN08]|uniref:Arc family DNA-binding protein n=1 Tax=Actinomycetospora aurantiaca TaxID=3129233 RepID=A0ABU8MT44_9PSEU
MARTITLRLPDEVYEMVRRYAESDAQSMNAWIESLVDGEDMRRRCAAHEEWLVSRPEHVRRAEAWADGNLDELAGR